MSRTARVALVLLTAAMASFVMAAWTWGADPGPRWHATGWILLVSSLLTGALAVHLNTAAAQEAEARRSFKRTY